MKITKYLVICIISLGLVVGISVPSKSIEPGLIRILEDDTDPDGWVKQITVTDGSLTISGSDATLAIGGAGEGEKKAVFKTVINKAGQWDLELYIPWKNNIWPNRKWGMYHLVVTDSNGDQHEIQFDSKAASAGWSLADSIDLPEGETTVTISNKTDGQFVVADAIQWSPSAGD